MSIRELILKNKNDISEKSLKVYTDNIIRLLKKLNTNNINIFLDTDKIIDLLNNYKSLTKRNYLNSIIVLLLNNEKFNDVILLYQNIRDDLNNEYDTQQRTREKTDKQKKNWISLEDILNVRNKIYDELRNNKDYNNNIQKYFILSFYLCFPLRNDLYNVKIIKRDEFLKLDIDDKENNNYLINDELPFLSIGDYKTSKKYGNKILYINGDLKIILNNYLETNPTNNLIYDIKNPNLEMTTNKFTILFKNIFKPYYPNKNIGTTMIRHIIISDKFNDTLEKMEQLSSIMGHSLSTQSSIYCKK